MAHFVRHLTTQHVQLLMSNQNENDLLIIFHIQTDSCHIFSLKFTCPIYFLKVTVQLVVNFMYRPPVFKVTLYCLMLYCLPIFDHGDKLKKDGRRRFNII